MKYLLTIYENEQRYASMKPENIQKMVGDYYGFNQSTKAAGQFVAGEALQPTSTATTVRVRDGERLVTDGPFAETKEQLGGFYLVDVKDLDEAIALAAKIPGVLAGCVEIRPIVDFTQRS